LKSNIPGNAIVHRDYKCVKSADLLVVNMDTFGEQRPLTGTIYELAWAWVDHKPVIIITDEEKYSEHPFIKDTASIIVSSVDELIEKKYINYFYKGLSSALY
jgi:nucleoside 2-deoxyribosyltransferase